jgi:PTS system mannose-specific IIA component
MIGVIVVTHGQLANELLNAAQTIVGELPQFAAVSIGWHDDATSSREAISRAIARLQSPDGVLILTDMFGGTPSNLGLTFLEANRVEIITGVNLPMLINLAHLQSSSDLLGVAREMREVGRNAIWVASDLLHAEMKTGAS